MSTQESPATVRYWAAARAATGIESETIAPGRVGAVLEGLAARHADLSPVLAVASVLVDGVQAEPGDVVPAGATVEILPPFAGG